MRSLSSVVAIAGLSIALVVVGCSQPAAPAPTAAPAVKAAEPTKAAAPAAPTAAPAAPTAAPAAPTAVPKVVYPEKGKAITIIIPWAAGGTTDVGTRLLAAELEKDLGTQVQVVNKPGAGTQTGLTEFVRAKPDGYTLAATNLPTTLLTYLDPDRKAIYSRKDFQPVGNLVQDPNAIAVKNDSPFKTMKDLIDAAKAKPEQVKLGTLGLMTQAHLELVMLEKEAGVKFSLVHFDGAAPATTALLGGHVDAIDSGSGGFTAQVKSGDVRLLGLVSSEESRFFPGVKPLPALGYNVSQASIRGLCAPTGTPKEIVDILTAAMKKAIASPDLKKKMDEVGFEMRYLDPVQFGTYWDNMEKTMQPIMELARKGS